jgi:8-oxo-dGTP pyrophosphatase MutT (NUDIX family)
MMAICLPELPETDSGLTQLSQKWQNGSMKEPPGSSDQSTPRNPWTRLARRQVYDNPWITVFEDQVLRPDGKPGIYGMVHYRHRAIGIVALDEHDRVLLVGQYRYPLDEYSWEIPEGGGPETEEPLATAKRELREETGFTAQDWRVIIRAHLSNCVTDEEAICYLATGLEPGVAEPEGTEQIQVRWVPFSEALAMIGEGGITDALSILGLQRVGLMRLESRQSRPRE